MGDNNSQASLAPSASNMALAISMSPVIPQGTQAAVATTPMTNTNVVGFDEGSAPTRTEQKRGRPRNYDVNLSARSTIYSQPPSTTSPPSLSADFGKRVRRRPRGAPKCQSFPCPRGCTAAIATGTDFVPQVIIVHPGEDVAQKLAILFHLSTSSMTILSCNGTIAIADISQSGLSGDVKRHEGRFEILRLSGLATSSRYEKDTALTILLAKPDGQVFGGTVTGALVAGGPVRIIVGTFDQSTNKRRYSAESSIVVSMQGDGDVQCTTTTSAPLKLVDAEVNVAMAGMQNLRPASDDALQLPTSTLDKGKMCDK